MIEQEKANEASKQELSEIFEDDEVRIHLHITCVDGDVGASFALIEIRDKPRAEFFDIASRIAEILSGATETHSCAVEVEASSAFVIIRRKEIASTQIDIYDDVISDFC